jgi:hypothetical protein
MQRDLVEYTVEEMSSPWDYGCQDETFDTEESESDWDGDSKKPFPIPDQLKRPGGSLLRSLISEESRQHSSFNEYSERMRETLRVERLEDSTIDYIVSTTKKFLEYVSRNVNQFPNNDGINHQVIIFDLYLLIFLSDDNEIYHCTHRRRGERFHNHQSPHVHPKMGVLY